MSTNVSQGIPTTILKKILVLVLATFKVIKNIIIKILNFHSIKLAVLATFLILNGFISLYFSFTTFVNSTETTAVAVAVDAPISDGNFDAKDELDILLEEESSKILSKVEIEDLLKSEFKKDEYSSLKYLKREVELKRKNNIIDMVEYTIQPGDTLSEIASTFGNGLSILKHNNPQTDKHIYPGQKLKIATINGIFYTIKKGDTLDGITKKFKLKDDDIIKYNSIKNNKIIANTEIFLLNPDLYVKSATTKGSRFIMPIKYNGLTSPFGYRIHPVLKRRILHAGLDLRAHYVPVAASAKGTVTFAGTQNGYGKIVIIKHSNGYETRYAHLNKIYVKKGQNVNQGHKIAQSGKTGRVTGPHLHFELRYNGQIKNPLDYIKV